MRRRLTDWAPDDVLANEREGEASIPIGPARAQGDPSLQRLQRLAGNRAVTSLVLPTRSLVVQREPTTKVVDELEGKFRSQGYPIGSSSIPKLTGGTGNYDVGAKVYGDGNSVLGEGEYSDDTHAEIVALDAAIGAHGLAAVRKIRVTKGCCRRCAVIMNVLSLGDKVGPRGSSSATGAYVVPTNIQTELRNRLNLYTVDDFCWVVSNGTWW